MKLENVLAVKGSRIETCALTDTVRDVIAHLKAAEVLLDRVEAREVWDYEIAYPVLHLLRYALELLLKACLGGYNPPDADRPLEVSR